MAKTDKQYLEIWKEFSVGIQNSTPVDATEKVADRVKRVKKLEADPEEWFKYYFPEYCKRPDGSFIEPADFHKLATRRIIANPEWYEVRNWSRELAKSTRTMEEVLYLALTARKRNVLIISNSLDNAERLLLPYKINLEANNRIIQDYGEQTNIGTWEAGEFTTKKGVAFRAIGAGQSPRGTRNEATRPDVILFDDLDTDEDCRNPDIIDNRWNWVSEAVIPTRSISNPLLVVWCGNVIAEDCCVVRAAEFADKVDKVNIRDEQGRSSWPQKNSEADIDRVLSQISYASQQKEYFNNPMSQGKTFAEVKWGPCPPLAEQQFVLTYADPAPSNKDRPGAKSTQGNSRKAIFTLARKGNDYFIYYGFLDVMGNSRFMQSMYECREYIKARAKGLAEYYYIENNTLQDPFYEQVLLPLMYESGPSYGGPLSITGDTRKKPEKWPRIEATLEPLNRLGHLIFNIEEKNNPHMLRLEAQFKAAKPTSKQLDGPDAIEGAVYLIKEKQAEWAEGTAMFAPRTLSSSKHI